MASLIIGYDFIFNVAIKKRNGKTCNKSSVAGLGITYESAVWDIHNKLKKRKSEILHINSVRVCRIAFAIENGKSMPFRLAEYPPDIPEDLNHVLRSILKNQFN